MVPNTLAAIDSLTMIANALSQEKKEAKFQYFLQNEVRFCIPKSCLYDEEETMAARNSSMTDKNNKDEVKHKILFSNDTKNAMARNLVGNFNTFAKEANITVNEIDRLLDHFPTLQAIAAATEDDFDKRFFDDRTKKAVCDFFGTSCGSSSRNIDDTMNDGLNEMTVGEDVPTSSQFMNDQPTISEEKDSDESLIFDDLDFLSNEQNHLNDDPLVANQSELFNNQFFPQCFDGSMLDEQAPGLTHELNNDDWNQDQHTEFNGNNYPTGPAPQPASYQYSSGPTDFEGQVRKP